jgi:hypothetical protein
MIAREGLDSNSQRAGGVKLSPEASALRDMLAHKERGQCVGATLADVVVFDDLILRWAAQQATGHPVYLLTGSVAAPLRDRMWESLTGEAFAVRAAEVLEQSALAILLWDDISAKGAVASSLSSLFRVQIKKSKVGKGTFRLFASGTREYWGEVPHFLFAGDPEGKCLLRVELEHRPISWGEEIVDPDRKIESAVFYNSRDARDKARILLNAFKVLEKTLYAD